MTPDRAEPDRGDSDRRLLQRTLSTIDRRARTLWALQQLGRSLLVLGSVALILHVLPVRTLVAIVFLAASSLVVILWLVIGWLRRRDLDRAAVLADSSSGLKDLLRSAWSLGSQRRRGDPRIDPSWLAIIEHRAASAAGEITPHQVVPLRTPATAYAGLALLLVWASLASLGIGEELLPLFDLGEERTRQATSDSGMDPMDAETVAGERVPDGEESGPPVPRLLRPLSEAEEAALAELGDLSEATVSAELAAELKRLAELTAEERAAAAEAAAAATGERTEGPDDATLGERLAEGEASADSELLRELGREMSEASAQRESDLSQTRGESAAAGDQQARMGGAQEGLSDPDAPVQEVDFPLAPLSTMQPSDDQQASDSALAGATGQSQEAQPGEAGGPQLPNPFGSSTGPQAAPTEPLGAETEMEVTLELAILEQQRQQPPEEPERIRRASPQRGAELAHVDVRASDRTRDERAQRPSTTPWRYRTLLRRFFAPAPPNPPPPADGGETLEPPGRR